MSDVATTVQAVPQPAQQQPSGIVGAIVQVGGAIVHSVPPAFLGLAVINAVFIGGVLLFLQSVVQAEERLAEARLALFRDVIRDQHSALLQSQQILVESLRVESARGR